MKTTMTLRRALDLAVSENEIATGQWKEAEAVIVKAGLCPHCACTGHRQKLGRYEAPTHETYGGRECPVCEEFIVCGEQANMEPNEPDYGGAFDGNQVTSDADPGL